MRISDWSSDVCSSDLAPSANDGRRLEATTPARIARQSWALAASCEFRRDDCASLSISRLGAILGGALQRMREVQRQKGGQAEGHRDVVKTIADRSDQRSGRPKARSGRGPGCFASVLQYGAAADEADDGNSSLDQAHLGRRCASANGDTDEHETATGAETGNASGGNRMW